MKLIRATHPRSQRLARIVRIITCGMLVASVAAGMVAPRARAADDVTTVVGTWHPTNLPPGVAPDQFYQEAQLYPDVGGRRLYVYGAATHWFAAYDLDSLQPIGAGLKLPDTATAFYVDPVGGRIFVGFQNDLTQQVHLDEFVTRSSGVVRVATIDLTAQLLARAIVGMYHELGTDLMWVLANRSATGSGAPAVAIGELGLHDFETGGSHAWHWQTPKELPECQFTLHNNLNVAAGLGYEPTHHSLYFGCGNPPLQAPEKVARGVGRLELNIAPDGQSTTPGNMAMFSHSGDFAQADSLFDPVSRRLTLSAYASVTQGSTVFVFDTVGEKYVGGITAGSLAIAQVGLDAVHGRFYGMSQWPYTGLILADVRATPSTQGASVPALAKHNGHQPAGTHLASDPQTGRLFLKYSADTDFVIVRDNLPQFVQVPPLDVDANTVNVPEEAGKTLATYSGASQAFGSRVRQIGGADAIFVNTSGVTAPLPVGPGTRQYVGAYLNRLQLGNNESTASAIGADTDTENTKGDLNKAAAPPPPSPPDGTPPPPQPPAGTPPPPVATPNPFEPAAGWPYLEALCSDFGDTPGVDSHPGASVSCHASEHVAQASAAAGSTDVGSAGVVTVGVNASSFTSHLTLDPDHGVVTEVSASSRGISLLNGRLHIGEVASVARAQARGRPGTTASSWSRTVKNVTLDGNTLCGDPCDIQALAAQLNGSLVGLAKVDFPTPQPNTASKGGYEATVRIDPLEHVEDVLVNEQPDDRIEVPGMVVTIFQDGFKPSRTIVDFAGVEAEARYGISLVEQPGGSLSGGPLPVADLLAGNVPGVGQGPIFGIEPGAAGDLGPAAPLGRPRQLALGSPLNGPGRILMNGLRRVAALLPIWALLLIPIYLSARRWLLLQRGGLILGGKP